MATINQININDTVYDIAVGVDNVDGLNTATSSKNGLVKVSDSYTTSAGNADSGVVASSKAVADCYNDLKNQVDDCFQSVSDGKTAVATALTNQGVATANDATFATMATNVGTVANNKYNAGVAATKVGTAAATDVLAGKTFTNASGVGTKGTMPNKTNQWVWTNSDNKGGFGVGEYTYSSGTKTNMVYAYTDKGYHDSTTKVIVDTEDYIKSCMLAGKTVVGVTGTATNDANASAAQILTGQTAYVKGSKVTGTMANQGAKTSSLNCGGSYTIPAGYHNGSGKVTANSLASQTSANATAAQILTGQTAYVNGSKITGTMPNRGLWTSNTSGSGNVTIPAGYHNGSGYVNCSGAYNKGVTDADNRANTNSTNYKTGYNKGVTDADNRANSSSVNYKSGYSAGQAASRALIGITSGAQGNHGANNYSTALTNGNTYLVICTAESAASDPSIKITSTNCTVTTIQELVGVGSKYSYNPVVRTHIYRVTTTGSNPSVGATITTHGTNSGEVSPLSFWAVYQI